MNYVLQDINWQYLCIASNVPSSRILKLNKKHIKFLIKNNSKVAEDVEKSMMNIQLNGVPQVDYYVYHYKESDKNVL